MTGKIMLGLCVLAASAITYANTYPDLPAGLKDGGGAIIDDTAYIGLGSLDNHFYRLDLKNPSTGWQAISDFPGGNRTQPVVTALDGKLYVFGGLQKNEKGELQLVNDAHVYSPEDKNWQKLSTRSPLGLVGTTAASYKDRIYFFGGSNLSIFNGYFQDYSAAGEDKAAQEKVMQAYFDKPIADFFFNNVLFSYQAGNNTWHNDGSLPYAGRAGAAVAVNDDSVIVANGEVKPGLRSSEVEQGHFQQDKVVWQKLPTLIAPADGSAQDGLAGAYSGFSHGHYLLTGGANFPGAQKAYAEGHYYAHKGLKKTYHSDVYTLENGAWKIVGQLPTAAGYGVSLSYDNKVLLIGGATADGALNSVVSLEYKDNKLIIE